MTRRVALKDTDSVIRYIKEDGGVILTDFSSTEDVQLVNADAAPHIKEIIDDRASQSLPRETSRAFHLFGRSETARERWLQQPAFLEILNHFLRTKSIPYNDNGATVIETDAILSSAATLDIGPGVKAQDVHRDDFIWQQTHTVKEGQGYQMDSDVGMGLLVPGVNTTKANGATLFVPGSHLWDHSRRPKTEEVVAAEMTVGEAFLFLASTVHAGGANTTSQSRPMHAFFYCRSWMRPEVRTLYYLHTAAGLLEDENQYLWWTEDEVRQWSPAAQKQAGYLLDSPFLGHCNETHPLDFFRVGAASRC